MLETNDNVFNGMLSFSFLNTHLQIVPDVIIASWMKGSGYQYSHVGVDQG